VKRGLLLAAAVLAAAAGTTTAAAAGGWRTVDRASDTGPDFTSAHVFYGGTIDVRHGRVTLRATKGKRVETRTHAICNGPGRTVSRTTRATYRSTGLPTRRLIGPTFARARACSFSVDATADGGQLRLTLEVRR
jgi:hypothetical protein